MDMGTNKTGLTIDGKEVFAEEGMTILEAARENGITIPTLCHHAALSSWGGCRMCVVQVDGSPKLAASCVTPVRKGMEIETSNEAILESRRMILEFLFAERNHNCMFCPQSGDCDLQKLAYDLQMDHLTVSFSYHKFPTDVTSEYMVIDHNRCILCGRCVRACRELAGARVLDFQNRGPGNLIGFDLNETRETSTCSSCGICMQLCPTGAINNRYRSHYSVKGHVKDRQVLESICPQCGLLCPTQSSVQENVLLKVEGSMAENNGRPDQGQLCYKGRFEVFKNPGRRLLHPMVKGKSGRWEKADWEYALDLTSERLSKAREKSGNGGVLGLTSSSISNEELLFFRDLMTKGWDAGSVDTLDGGHFHSVAGAWKEVGRTFWEASWMRIPEADFIMVIGADPKKTHPLISLLIRKSITEKGTKVAMINDTDSLFPFVSYRLPPCLDQGLLSLAILGEASASLKEGAFAVNRDILKDISVRDILKKIGLGEDERRIFHDIVRAFVNAKKPLIITGGEINTREFESPLAQLIRLALLKGLMPENRLGIIVLKPGGNSAGAWKLGLPSAKGNHGGGKGKAGFVILGDGDAAGADLSEHLKGMDFLAVLSPYIPEKLKDRAHVFIPKPLWMEEDGTFTSLDGSEIAYKKKVLDPPEGMRESWQILKALADRAGFHPGYSTWEDLREKAKEEAMKPMG
ncbi:MAG: molybdopterin-dependent oxidoreductase [Pseudomonadota bacterium]